MFPHYVPKQTHKTVIAHRGGAGLWPENTLYALQQAHTMGVDLSEIDIHCSKDGVFVVIHDDTVDRTTNGQGKVLDLTLKELKQLDAGFYWTQDGGKTFPFRGQNIVIPTLEEILITFAQQPISLELKFSNAKLLPAFCQLLQNYHMHEKVLVSSFQPHMVHAVRKICPVVATAATQLESLLFFNIKKYSLGKFYLPGMTAFQMPAKFWGRQVITDNVVATAHRWHKRIDVWTINEIADMRHLLEQGVDGLITDFPDKLLSLLGRI